MNEAPRAPLRMAPSFSARPWGGTRLKDTLGKPVPENGPYGEAWELSDHPDGPSRVADGPFAGEFFGELVRRDPQAMLGRDRAPARFPLLVKYIDAAQDLSVQVHPDDDYAARHTAGDRGKTECWFIMDCGRDTEMILGLVPGTTRASLKRAIDEGRVAECVARHPIRPGMFIFVPAGTVHAVLADTLLCEVQQSSNTTYRFHDWDRRPPRELHIEHSLAVIDYEADPTEHILRVPETPDTEREERLLTDNAFFSVRAVLLAPQAKEVLTGEGCAIVNVVRGAGACNDAPCRTGETFFIPAAARRVAFTAGPAGMTLLVSGSNEL